MTIRGAPGGNDHIAKAERRHRVIEILPEGLALVRFKPRGACPSPKPVGFGSAILKVVDAETAPKRVFFGEQPTQVVPYMYQQRLAEWAAWAPVSLEAAGK